MRAARQSGFSEMTGVRAALLASHSKSAATLRRHAPALVVSGIAKEGSMWVKLDDHFDQHPKIAQAGPLGVALWVASIAYCNRNLTDGFVPWAAARTLVSWEFLQPTEDGREKVWEASATCGMSGMEPHEMTAFVIGVLVKAGLWHERKGGYEVHDYLDYQPSKDTVLRDREKTAKRVAEHRAKTRNAVTNGDSNGARNGHVTGAPYPVSRNEEEKNKPNPSARRRRSGVEVEGFAKFYDGVYPRKKDRIAAHRAFCAALDRHRHITAEELAWAAGEYAKTVAEKELEFVKHPATWLNAGGYLEWLEDKPSGEEEAGHA